MDLLLSFTLCFFVLEHVHAQLSINEEHVAQPFDTSCPRGHVYLSATRECLPAARLYGKCHLNDQCRAMDGNSVCNLNTGTCQCTDGTRVTSVGADTLYCGAVRPCYGRSLNYAMTPSSDCGTNQYCRLNICQCIPGFVPTSSGNDCARVPIEQLDFPTVIHRAANVPQVRTEEDEGKNLEIINERFERYDESFQMTHLLIGLLLLLNILTMSTLICIRLRRKVYKRNYPKDKGIIHVEPQQIARNDAYIKIPKDDGETGTFSNQTLNQPPPYDTI